MRTALAAALVGCAAAAATASAAITRVEDFTLSCSPASVGAGHHGVVVAVNPHVPDPRGSGEELSATVRLSDTVYGPMHLVHVDTKQGVFVNRTRCKRSPVRVPLTRRGIAGRASPYWTAASCLLEDRVVVHIRVAHSPTGKVTSAAIAVRSAKGRPIAYGFFRPDGTSSFYATQRCDLRVG